MKYAESYVHKNKDKEIFSNHFLSWIILHAEVNVGFRLGYQVEPFIPYQNVTI